MKKVLLITLFAGLIFAQKMTFCPEFIQHFDNFECTEMPTIPRNVFGWEIAFVLDKGHERQTLVIRRKNISDPKVREKVLAGVKLMDEIKEDFVFKTKQKFVGDEWYVDILDSTNFSQLSLKTYDDSITFNFLFRNILLLAEHVEALHKMEVILVNFDPQTLGLGDKHLKLFHFEDAARTDEEMDDRGDFRYWEPDQFGDKPKVTKFDQFVDVYAFGVMMYQFFNKENLPFPGTTKNEIVLAQAINDVTFAAGMTPEIIFLIIGCLKLQRKKRPTFASIVAALKNINARIDTSKPITTEMKLNLYLPIPDELKNKIDPVFLEIYQDFNPVDYSKVDSRSLLAENNLIAVIIGVVLVIAVVVLIFMCCGKNKDQNQTADLTHDLDAQAHEPPKTAGDENAQPISRKQSGLEIQTA